jgi:hypothetical protein
LFDYLLGSLDESLLSFLAGFLTITDYLFLAFSIMVDFFFFFFFF